MGKLLKGIALAFGPQLIEAGAKYAAKKLAKLTRPKPNT